MPLLPYPVREGDMERVLERQCTPVEPCTALVIESDEQLAGTVESYARTDGGFSTLRATTPVEALPLLEPGADIDAILLGAVDTESLKLVRGAAGDKIPIIGWTDDLEGDCEALMKAGAKMALEKGTRGRNVIEFLRVAITQRRISDRWAAIVREREERIERLQKDNARLEMAVTVLTNRARIYEGLLKGQSPPDADL